MIGTVGVNHLVRQQQVMQSMLKRRTVGHVPPSSKEVKDSKPVKIIVPFTNSEICISKTNIQNFFLCIFAAEAAVKSNCGPLGLKPLTPVSCSSVYLVRIEKDKCSYFSRRLLLSADNLVKLPGRK